VQHKGIIGVIALLLGIIALALAAIPRAVFDVPPPWPTQREPEPKETIEGGKSYEWKGMKITIGGKRTIEPRVQVASSTAAKLFAIATIVFALLGAAASCIACWRERSYALALPGAGFCCLALFWHYVLLGVSVGVTILVLILILHALAGGI
jgi:hypothetical protein